MKGQKSSGPGPLMVDVGGYELTLEDRELLRMPAVGGVILFSRNYADLSQLRALVSGIKSQRESPLLVAVDHEGGRVQRFIEGFTRLPAAGVIGDLFDTDPQAALRLAELHGWVSASELRALDVDLSFAPVLDLKSSNSSIIGQRAFHERAERVVELASAMIVGLSRGGMAATGKHFPGHGTVAGDSHHMLPVDPRALDVLRTGDLKPFRRLAAASIASLMMAHVSYPAVDPVPACFSSFWIQTVLRRELGFSGAVLSDDLSMGGAVGMGTVPERATRALAAGCDMVLVCNDREGAAQAAEALRTAAGPDSERATRLDALRGRKGLAWEQLGDDPDLVQARLELAALAGAAAAT